MNNRVENLQYPIGRFVAADAYSNIEISEFLHRIKSFPLRLEGEVEHLTPVQLDTPYRDGGWTVRQLIHHIADSHSNAYIRTKWTLTEDSPLIKAYDEKLWALTPETAGEIELSLLVIKSLHQKWTSLLEQLSESDRLRYFIHPETQRKINLNTLIHNYAWHGDHHLAHIANLRLRMSW